MVVRRFFNEAFGDGPIFLDLATVAPYILLVRARLKYGLSGLCHLLKHVAVSQALTNWDLRKLPFHVLLYFCSICSGFF